ncbi:uncharacterized protein [Musca autumnalis]|uniref:uncharacterized protein n=1 Tax=Musca autumnalis TaxID=221902 RepID=UPI003CEB2356
MDDIRQAPSHMVMEEAAAGLTNLSLPLKMTSQKEVTENLPASALAGVSNDSLNLGNEEPVIPSGIPAPPPVDHSRGDQSGEIPVDINLMPPPPAPLIEDVESGIIDIQLPPSATLEREAITSLEQVPKPPEVIADEMRMPPPPPPPPTTDVITKTNLDKTIHNATKPPLTTPDSGVPITTATSSALASTLQNPLQTGPTPDSGIPPLSITTEGNLSNLKTPFEKGAITAAGGATSSIDEQQFYSNLEGSRTDSSRMASTPVARPELRSVTSERKSFMEAIDIHQSTATEQPFTSRLSKILEEHAVRPSQELIPLAAVPHDGGPPQELIPTAIPELSQGTNLSSQATAEDGGGWYRDWLAILRERQQNVSYTHTTVPQRKKRPRPRPRRLNVDEEEPPSTAANAGDQAAVAVAGGVASEGATAAAVEAFFSNFLNETRAPQQPPPVTDENDNNMTNGFAAAAAPPHPPPDDDLPSLPPSQESAYHQFVRENTDDLSLIWENIESCYALLGQHINHIENESTDDEDGHLQEAFRKYDIQTLLNAPRKRLNVKLNIIQNLIRHNSFDFTKLPCIEDRLSAAMGFAFILELKAAGFISLSSDGCTVALL